MIFLTVTPYPGSETEPEVIDAPEKEKLIYEQSCQWYRFQAGLMSGRLQTITALEGGMLYGSIRPRFRLLKRTY